MFRAVLFFVAFLAQPAYAQTLDLGRIVAEHVVPGFDRLAAATANLAKISESHCAQGDDLLKEAYGEAFDAWVEVSHLRFGPTETDNRAFALAFWPDAKGATGRTLRRLISDEDPVIEKLETFQTVSIAARGFYALEALLFDPDLAAQVQTPYGCALVRAIAEDIADTSGKISADWRGDYGRAFVSADNALVPTPGEAERLIFSALMNGLEFTSDVRLGRPLGTYDQPRPHRAEARLSGRSLRHVTLSLVSMWKLAALVSGNDRELDAGFEYAIRRAWELDDPVFAGVSEPQSRIRIEVLQQWVTRLRRHLGTEIAPRLGIAVGFNALDGD